MRVERYLTSSRSAARPRGILNIPGPGAGGANRDGSECASAHYTTLAETFRVIAAAPSVLRSIFSGDVWTGNEIC